MNGDLKTTREMNMPPLRVFRGPESSENEDQPPHGPGGRTRREWNRQEAFWAGRNLAHRLSTRFAA